MRASTFFMGCAALTIFLLGALTFYLFFNGSEYFIRSLVSTIAIPIFFIVISMFFEESTRFIMINIIIVPVLTLTTWFFSLEVTLILWLAIEVFVYITRKTSIYELKESNTPSSWLNNNHREVYTLHGLISATAVGYLYFLGYQNGVLGQASNLISSTGKEGMIWSIVRFSLWPLLGLFLIVSYLFLMMFLREILEYFTLNRKVSDLLDEK